MGTTECHFGGGLNSSSGGELKLYLGCTGSTNLPPLVLETRMLPQYQQDTCERQDL